MVTAVILIGVAVITACAVNLKPTNATGDTATPTILNGVPAEYTGQAQKIVTNLPTGMRYAISTEYIDPTTIDAGKIVPAGYTALDYLQTTGTQYIDTGVIAGDKTRVVIDWNYNSMKLQQRVFSVSPTNNTFGFEVYINSMSQYGYSFGGTKWDSTKVSVDLARHVIDFNASENILKIDNGALANQKLSASVGNLPKLSLYLFSRNHSDDSDNGEFASGNAYSCQIYENGAIVRDLVPVRRADNKLGMYDWVENKFYQNNGTGEFVAGKEVNTALKGKDLVWANSIDNKANEVKLEYGKKYYVYYYTANSDTTTADGKLSVKEFVVEKCANHVYGEWSPSTATCTTDGEHQRVCEICGNIDIETVPALGHDFIAEDFDKNTGITTLVCSICKEKSDLSYPCKDKENGHSFIDKDVDPDCETLGCTIHTCTTCNFYYKDNYVPATGHKYGTWITIEPATTDAAGVQKRICDQCGAEQTRSIAPLAGTTSNGGKDNSAPLLWGIIIGIIAVLAGCGGLAWLLLAVFKPKKEKNTEPPKTPKPTKTKREKKTKVATA